MYKPHFSLVGFQRRKKQNYHACGFVIYLDPILAQRAFNHKMNDTTRRLFIQKIQEVVGYVYTQVIFYEDTAFIRSLSVEGDCACLGIDGSSFSRMAETKFKGERFIDFHTHNVDTKAQAFDLLAAFSFWAETVDAICEKIPEQ